MSRRGGRRGFRGAGPRQMSLSRDWVWRRDGLSTLVAGDEAAVAGDAWRWGS